MKGQTKMRDKFKRYRLWAIVFALTIATQACSFNYSVGDPIKISDSEAETIATKTLQSFNRSIQRGDFGQFHDAEVAASYKNELTTEKFNQAFAAFIARHIDIRPAEGAKMSFSPSPAIDGQYLNLYGSYPAQIGKPVNFKLQYVREGDWKLKYIDINIQ